MSKKHIYFFGGLTILLFFSGLFSGFNEQDQDDFSEKVKVSLRYIGHELLLANQDSTSLVLPVVEVNPHRFQLSFQNDLSIEPKDLANFINNSFEKASLPSNYIVEVIQCFDHKVAYSFEMKNKKENSIIPCFGRVLKKNCYLIQVKFTDKPVSNKGNQILFFGLVVLVFFLLTFIYIKRKPEGLQNNNNNQDFKTIGDFHFYPEQNKLVKEAIEISLSKKECELLSIFIENPNQIIKRDVLAKRVWEDHGVIVGRSLDTYISKLRKKLKGDDTIQLTNVHGVGYKLEVDV